MVADPILTDEELAEVDALAAQFPARHLVPVAAGHLSGLIAALRDRRAEVERLKTNLDRHHAFDPGHWQVCEVCV